MSVLSHFWFCLIHSLNLLDSPSKAECNYPQLVSCKEPWSKCQLLGIHPHMVWAFSSQSVFVISSDPENECLSLSMSDRFAASVPPRCDNADIKLAVNLTSSMDLYYHMASVNLLHHLLPPRIHSGCEQHIWNTLTSSVSVRNY